MPSIPFAFDMLMRPVKFVKSTGVYVIIVAGGGHATANTDKGVRVLEIKTDTSTGVPITATLLEAPSNAGEDFATLNAVGGGEVEFAAEVIYCIVAPKSKDALEGWFDMYVRPISIDGSDPSAPFLWRLSIMQFADPAHISFKIRYKPHIIGGPEGQGIEPMVQMYPNADGTDLIQKGWVVFSYRTDKEGTGPMFQGPPEWRPDVIQYFSPDPDLSQHGLLFGTDPPLIDADVPI